MLLHPEECIICGVAIFVILMIGSRSIVLCASLQAAVMRSTGQHIKPLTLACVETNLPHVSVWGMQPIMST